MTSIGSGVLSGVLLVVLLGCCCCLHRAAAHGEQHQSACKMSPLQIRFVYGNCNPVVLRVFACRGTCHSYTTVSRLGLQVERVCRCCQPTTSRKRHVPLECPDPEQPGSWRRRLLPVMLPQDCSCRPCSDGPI